MTLTESERLDMLLDTLLGERAEYSCIRKPDDIVAKRELLRALMNVRPPMPLPDEILNIQDAELSAIRDEKGVIEAATLPRTPLDNRLSLWQGDITRLKIDAIVNAANSAMLGCFVPLHKCIDNAIHSGAGMQLRQECHRLIQKQGHDEATGCAKITSGYNLPAKYVIHTVGPIVYGPQPTDEDCRLLAACYTSCLSLADSCGLHSVAFCCISTGEFRFPQQQAAKIAVRTVTAYLDAHPDASVNHVVFNVFKQSDLDIYKALLGYE